MGLLDTLLGKTGKKVAKETLAANQGQATAGYDAQKNYLSGGYSSANARLQPYATQGTQANTTYGNFLGMNGAEAQKGAMAGYEAYNPYLNATMDSQMKAVDRRAAATGQLNSGMGALARARVADETSYRNYSDYLNRVQGMGAQGMQASNALAGYDMGYGQGLAGIDGNYRSGMTGSQNQYSQNYLAADQAPWQNLLGAVGTGLGAFNAFKSPSGGANGFGEWQTSVKKG